MTSKAGRAEIFRLKQIRRAKHVERHHLLFDKPDEVVNNVLFHQTVKTWDVVIAKENLKDIVSVFDKNKVPYWLMFGTLLGCTRDSKLIEYDSDLDFGCYSDNYRQIASAIEDLEVLGFKLIRAWQRVFLLSIIRNGVYADIIMFNKIKGGAYQNGAWRLNPEDLLLMKRDFLGIEVNISRNYKKMLVRWYGKVWRRPVKGLGPKGKNQKICPVKPKSQYEKKN